MANGEHTELGRPPQHRTQPIDTVACIAALSWFGLAIALSWWRSETLMLTALTRAIVGAIAVYVVVFIGYYLMLRMAYAADSKRRAQKAAHNAPAAETDTADAQASTPTQDDGIQE